MPRVWAVFFFPRSAELGLAVEDTASPRVLAKMVLAGTIAASFDAASQDLKHLANLAISDERDPREILRTSCVYYENHADRMDYPSYRRLGFPLTSSLIESTVK